MGGWVGMATTRTEDNSQVSVGEVTSYQDAGGKWRGRPVVVAALYFPSSVCVGVSIDTNNQCSGQSLHRQHYL